jgi:hypothetical protein
VTGVHAKQQINVDGRASTSMPLNAMLNTARKYSSGYGTRWYQVTWWYEVAWRWLVKIVKIDPLDLDIAFGVV